MAGDLAAPCASKFIFQKCFKCTLSIWEIQNTNDHANLGYMNSSLREAKGGALGVKGIEEVRIEFTEKANLAEWGNSLISV